MKKIIGILLVAATLFSMVGCSKSEAKKSDKQVLDVIISQYGNYIRNGGLNSRRISKLPMLIST